MLETDPARLSLAHTPTPIAPLRRLSNRWDCDLWIKRDDMTGGPEAGNKIRKLEYLLADAQAKRCDTLITCGGIQSNHARATALLGAQLGFRVILMLRVTDVPVDASPLDLVGNVLLDRLAGAQIIRITPSEYRDRHANMAAVASEQRQQGHTPYVIVEGGSDGLGAFGYVRAVSELQRQLDAGLGPAQRFDVIVHACGSGGTTAGLVLGAGRHNVAAEVRAIAVSDDRATFTETVGRIMSEARNIAPHLDASCRLTIEERFKGPGYAKSTPALLELLSMVARTEGVVLDPVYTAKAMSAIETLCREGELRGKRILFLHTGGVFGLMPWGPDLRASIDALGR